MKSSIPVILALYLVFISSSLQAQTVPVAAIQQPHADKIAAVQAGTLTTAQASWWGFDAVDATDALQRAIDSKVPHLVIDNQGSDWIVNKTLNLVSNQTIVFEENVTLQAKKGEFQGTHDSLLSGRNVEGVTLIGKSGATLRMHREDYANPKLYKKAEWRHGISFFDSKNIVMRGLTVKDSGGDGLYLGASVSGYNKNVLVEDMAFDGNYRLGMAVISAEDLIIRRSEFINTKGTAPQGGLDFEPNYAEQRLVNCVVEDSSFTNNLYGAGIELYLIKLNRKSLPVSISFKRAKVGGNGLGVKSTISSTLGSEVTGNVQFIDSTFDHNRLALYAPANGVQHLFTNCTFDYGAASQKIKATWDNAPILLATDAHAKETVIGNVSFKQSTAILEAGASPIKMPVQGNMSLADSISGTLFVERNKVKSPYDLVGYVKRQQEYLATIKSLKPAHVELSKLVAPPVDAARKNNGQFYLQGAFTFLQYAEQGQQIAIQARAQKVYDKETVLELQSPQGAVLGTYKVPLNGTVLPITFTAAETGLYRVVRKTVFSQYVDITSSHRGNGLLVDGKLLFLPKNGQIYFQVPAGVKTFSVSLSTDSTADAALLDSQGNVVEKHDNISGLQVFSGHRTDASKSEVWSLRVANTVWLVTLFPYEPLVPLFSTNPDTLLQLP